MAEEELVELKFRLADGSDIGPNRCSLTTPVASLKEFIISRWPEDKANAPRSIHDIKLINAGKILENNKTVGDSWVWLPGGSIVMHVVVKPPVVKKNAEKWRSNPPKHRCSCSIL